MTQGSSGALIGWSRRQSAGGTFIHLQLATSPEALAARDFQMVTLSLNDLCLQSFSRDLSRAVRARGLGVWPRLRWWLPRSESLLIVANALLGVVITAAAEILSLLIRGSRRLIVWRSRIEARMRRRRSRAPLRPPSVKRRRRASERPAAGVAPQEAVRLP